MKLTKFVALTTAVVVMSGSVLAVTGVDVNLAGKQRMLTQKMSKEVALIASGVDVSANVASLKASHDLFDKTLKGLRTGDEGLGLAGTSDGGITGCLDSVEGVWSKFGGSIAEITAAGSVSDEQLQVVATRNRPLLTVMNRCVKLFEKAVGDSGASAEIAMAINVVGRQRMLTQKMSKEFFLLSAGYKPDYQKGEIAKTIAQFDGALSGLINGDSVAGLPVAPSAEIKAQLEKVKGMWAPFKAVMEKAAAGEALTDADKKAVAAQNMPLLKAMNAAVVMYTKL